MENGYAVAEIKLQHCKEDADNEDWEKLLDPDKGELKTAELYIKVEAIENVFLIKDKGAFLKDAPFKMIGNNWHEPIKNGEITLHNYGGDYKPKGSTFGKVRLGYNEKTKKTYKKPHTGLDIFAESGTQLYACLDGTINSIDKVGAYGNVIVLEIDVIEELKSSKNKYQLKYTNEIEIGPKFNFNGKIYLRYAHVQSASVKVGQKVNAGDKIGLSGISGNAKKTQAPHLHFEITNNARPPKGLNYKCNPSFYVNVIPEEKANKANQEKVRDNKRKEFKK